MKTAQKLNSLAGLILLAVPLLFTANQVSAQTQPQSSNSPAGNSSSYNWAGYVATNGTYTSVTGTWVIPAATSSNNLSADATWVGIGGVASTDLIQAGTMNNSGQYQAWFETLPQAISPISLAVKAGDSITVSLNQQSAGVWSISFNNNTTGQNYQTSIAYNSSVSSAEWIEEMPASNFGFIPLDNFGLVQFTNDTTLKNGQTVTISGAGAQMMTMINNNNQALAAPSSLSPDGSSFTVARSSASPTGTSTTVGVGHRHWSRVGRRIQGYRPPPQRSVMNFHFSRNSFQSIVFRFR